MLWICGITLNGLINKAATVRNGPISWSLAGLTDRTGLHDALILLSCITIRLYILLTFLRWGWRCGHLLVYLRLIWSQLLLLLRLNELLLVATTRALHLIHHHRWIRVRHANLLARVYDVLKVLAGVARDMWELGLTGWARGVGCRNCQPIDIALEVFMHRAMTAGRSRHPPRVNSAWVGHGCIRNRGWSTQARFDTLLHSWINLTRPLLHPPWLLGSMHELRMEVRLTVLSDGRTRQVGISTAILIYLNRICEVMLLVNDYLIVEMCSTLRCRLRHLRAHDLLARWLVLCI